MNKQEAHCGALIEATAQALNDDVVTLMLVAVQKHNLGLSVNLALERSVLQFKRTGGGNLIELCRVGGLNKLDTESIVLECVISFPYLWASVHLASFYCTC